ncbi:hypothetical protein HDU98_005570 [Podochytrium sp. JEL0797]|nr:hypothetical protein HDU98_005570 [Podochytrium sp. JEL0797]
MATQAHAPPEYDILAQHESDELPAYLSSDLVLVQPSDVLVAVFHPTSRNSPSFLIELDTSLIASDKQRQSQSARDQLVTVDQFRTPAFTEEVPKVRVLDGEGKLLVSMAARSSGTGALFHRWEFVAAGVNEVVFVAKRLGGKGRASCVCSFTLPGAGEYLWKSCIEKERLKEGMRVVLTLYLGEGSRGQKRGGFSLFQRTDYSNLIAVATYETVIGRVKDRRLARGILRPVAGMEAPWKDAEECGLILASLLAGLYGIRFGIYLDQLSKPSAKQALFSLAAISLVALIATRIKRTRSPRQPPSDPQYPLIGCLPSFWRPLLNGTFYLYFRKAQSGPIVTHNLFGKIEYHVSDPAQIKRILTSPDFVRSDFLLASNKDLFEYALFGMQTDSVWRKHRKAIQSGMGPLFVQKAFVATVDLVDDMVRMLNAHIAEAEGRLFEVNIREYSSVVTLDVIGKVGFSHDFMCLEGYDRGLWGKEGSGDALRENIDRMSSAGLVRVLVPSFLYGVLGVSERALKPCGDYFTEMVDTFLVPRRRRVEEIGGTEEEGSADLLSALLGKDAAGKMEFTDKEIRDQALALLLAGHDTTSNTITNVFLHLNSDIVAKMREEIDSLIGKSGTPTFDGLSKFVYVESVFRETQRINPVVMGLDRVAARDVEVLGYSFKKGTYFSCNIQSAMLDESIWGPDALEFNPDRWNDRSSVPDGAFLPFSAGPHSCVGNKMALMEAKVVLIKLIQHFDFQIVEGQRLEAVDGIVVHLPDGLKLAVSKRQ